MVSQHGRDAPQCTFLSRWPTASRHSATTPHLARHLLGTRIAVQTGRSCGQGQLSKPRQVVTQFPWWHGVSLDGDTKRYLLATHDQRRTRGTRDAAATGASPRHQDRAIAGGAVANPMGLWAIPIAVVLETVGIPILSRPKLLLPSVVSSWHGPDAPLASTVDLVAMQVPNFSDYHKHLPVEMVAKRALAPTMGISETALNSDSPRKGRGPWWGARLERALPRLLIAIANRPCALHRKSIGQRPFWATTNSAPLELLNVQGQATE